MICAVCQKDVGDDYCELHEKELVESVHIGKTELGHTAVYIRCKTKNCIVENVAYPHYRDDEYHQPYAEFSIEAKYSDEYRYEIIRVPFETEPDEKYAMLHYSDKYDITIIIVPYDVVYSKEWVELHDYRYRA